MLRDARVSCTIFSTAAQHTSIRVCGTICSTPVPLAVIRVSDTIDSKYISTAFRHHGVDNVYGTSLHQSNIRLSDTINDIFKEVISYIKLHYVKPHCICS